MPTRGAHFRHLSLPLPPLIGALLLAACSRRPDPTPSRTPNPPPAQASEATDSLAQPVAKSDPAAAEPATKAAESEWQIVPGHAGPVTKQSSEAELRQHYGASVVESTRVDIGEGETAVGAVLYPADTLRRAEIIWKDSVNRRQPARLMLKNGGRTLWQVEGGISMGTSLKELERLNGRPFTLAGFAWDYGGVITDWKGGALTSLRGIRLYLDPGASQYESKAYQQVVGDQDFASSLPPMQQLNPRVRSIFVDFDIP